MTRVLFVIGNMEIGGTRTSLINLSRFLSKSDKVQIDFFILHHSGVLFDRIPKEVNVLPEEKCISDSLPGLKKKTIASKIYHLFIFLARVLLGYNLVYSKIYKRIAKRIGFYDVVIGYQEGVSNDCASFLSARKHYYWIHNDITNWYEKKYDIPSIYDNADGIIFVANAAKEVFVQFYPTLSDKCLIIKNTIDYSLIKEKSFLSGGFEKRNHLIIISVGRICEQKAYGRVLDIVELVKPKAPHFEWHIIGGGDELSSFNELCIQRHLDDTVYFDGAFENPYPYMKSADLLAVTSLYESQPMVILESLCLGVPVISTRFSSAEEILENKEYGIVVDQDIHGFAESLIGILINNEKYQRMKESAKQYHYDNHAIVNSVFDLL